MNQPPVKRYNNLIALLNRYAYAYHVDDAPLVSDAVYDSLYAELKAIEATNPTLIRADSPSQRVGGVLKGGFTKVHHRRRMLSLNDVFSVEEVTSWAKRIEALLPVISYDFFMDIKMDGLAASLVYKDGVLVRAVTRGDGYIGEDITANVRTIKTVPLSLRHTQQFEHFLTGRTELRGEIVILKKDFDALNARQRAIGKPVFANPRNLAAGTVRQLDPRLVASRPLTFIVYDVLRDDEDEIPTHMSAYEAATALGFRRNEQACVVRTIDEVERCIQTWDTQRHDLPFATDGLVVKINNRHVFNQLGVVGKQPRGAVAFKYQAEQATTTVRDIVISIGRTGAATPVAVFDPVVVAGTTVQHASLHNADEIARLDIRRGDVVVIYKAGDIIPQVESVITELRPPETTPIDYEAELARQYPEMEFERPSGEAIYRVKGLDEPIILKRSLLHFASRSALDIESLGTKNIEAIVDAGLVSDLADIYTLTTASVIHLERFGRVSAEKLITAIAAKKQPPLERFVYGLGIRHVGVQTAHDLTTQFGSLDALRNATLQALQSIRGIGDIVAESIVAWFADEDNNMLLDKFAKLGVRPHYEQRSNELEGITFAITGTLDRMSRDDAADRIRGLGGVFHTTVTKETTYLVAGGAVGASKLAKATQYGTKIITEQELLQLLHLR